MNNPVDYSLPIVEQVQQLQKSFSMKKQLDLIQQILGKGEVGQKALLDILIDRHLDKTQELVLLDGILFEFLISINIDKIQNSLTTYFPNGLVELKSSLKIDYQPLQELLISQQFQAADKLTQIHLCTLAGLNNSNSRNWLYFTDIALLPSEDLATIDLLWRIYSRGKFGFSVQRKIWLANDCNWEKLWNSIGWKHNGVACRYPEEFIWEINAPKGHLPLFNQLRGVQVLLALFQHIVWN
uniref:GUN4-like domain-containing protein n=1 Tax=Schimmelmannia schousboei TaxID=173468 RepID=A0A1C9C8V4_9FLOR|nr:hypothetical protein Schim_118 [Schimmelmannia schousboei]AOM64799.1 hypothetical protein Schim_118 [Schimmelmannia schousboei]